MNILEQYNFFFWFSILFLVRKTGGADVFTSRVVICEQETERISDGHYYCELYDAEGVSLNYLIAICRKVILLLFTVSE